MHKVLLIDGFGLIFRAYYALLKRPLYTSKGVPTSAIYGFWKMVFRSLKEIEPDSFVIAFDSPKKTFRKEIYPDYKANREEAPDDLKEQIRVIVEMVKAHKVPCLMKNGLEADDIIAFLSKKFESEGKLVYILSSDKDLSQLVSENIKIARPEQGVSELKIMGEAEVFEKFNVKPDQILDYLALLGDHSDNIPGVKGIGEKTASALLKDWGNLDNIYKNIGLMKSESIKRKLIEGKESAYLSKKLATLQTNIGDVEVNWERAHFTAESLGGLTEEFKKYEFHGLIKDDTFIKTFAAGNEETVRKISESIEPALFEMAVKFEESSVNYRLVTKKSELLDLKERIIKAGFCSVDTETTSENVFTADLIGVSIALKEKEAFYIPLFDQNPAEFNKSEFFQVFGEILSFESIKKIGQNIKYDYQILKKYAPLKGIYFDTLLGAYLLDPDEKKYNMDYLALKYLNYQTIHYHDLVEKGKTLLNVDLNAVKNYSCEDADITLRLYNKIHIQLKENALERVFFELEMPLIEILAEMELLGIKLDLTTLKSLEELLSQKIAMLEKEIHELAGLPFNINSTRQVGEILFDKMGLPSLKKTKTGYSTDESVLEELKVYPIAAKILEYRKMNKLLNTYIQTLPSYMIDGRIHTSYHQSGTATGRLSSSEPNLQNIPTREEIGNQIRKSFVAEEGFVFISADYSQVELRIFAALSGDENMKEAFLKDRDVHKFTASLIFGVPEEQVDHFQRGVAKTINFGIIYGMGPFKLSQEIGISLGQAKQFIERYFQFFPGIRKYMEVLKEDAKRAGYVKTLFGRKRYLRYINSGNKNLRESDERTAVNSAIQGTNADILKKVMIEIFPGLKQYQARLLLQIHDELLFEVPETQSEKIKKFIQDKMENTVKLKVPLKVTISCGKNWGELK